MKQLLLICTALCCGCINCQTPQYFITGYYPSWRLNEQNQFVRPTSIPYEQYDIVIFAFLNVEADGTLSLIRPEREKPLLLGPVRANAPEGYLRAKDLGDAARHQPGQRFADYAHRSRTRFTVSVGGWEHSANFPIVAADPMRRARFAAECVRAVRLYNLDGIDIDWEYPGDAARGGTPADRDNFTALLREVRQGLDAARQQLGRDLMLTIACGAAPKHLAAIDWPNTHRLVNAINLMTYSFYGQWDAVSNHNAPLFPPANATQPGYSCAEAVQTLLLYGVPPAKINLGLAFYGRSYLTVGLPGLHVQTTGQPDRERFARNATTPLYYEIVRHLRNGHYDYRWDDTAQVPYLIGLGSNASFVSFDDERSIALKAHYVRLRQMRGVVIWDITGEYQEIEPKTPLTNAVRRVFSGLESMPPSLQQPRIFAYPATLHSGFVHLFVHALSPGRTEAYLLDMQGRTLHFVSFSSLGHTINMRNLPSGTYRLKAQLERSSVAVEFVIVKK